MWIKVLVFGFLYGVCWSAEAQCSQEQLDHQSRLYEVYATGQIEKWPQLIQGLKDHPQLSVSVTIQYEITFI